jgi:uncharacterized surface protein with fasciclin (FAS1) repeats
MSLGLASISCENEDAIKNLLQIAQSTEGLESLIVMVNFIEANMEEADIAEELADSSLSFTVFAPNNAAFVDFFESEGTIITETDIVESTFAGPFNTDAELAEGLLDVLGLHAIEDQELYEADLIAAGNSSIGPTLYGGGSNYLDVDVDFENNIRLTPNIFGGSPTYILTTDIEASNGVAHIVNTVMFPIAAAN